MGELIWIGNILLPRGLVWAAVGGAVLIVVCLFVWLSTSTGRD